MDGRKRNRELTETRVIQVSKANMVYVSSMMQIRQITSKHRLIQALREELATAERRAEEERISHNATKMVICQSSVYSALYILQSFFCYILVTCYNTGSC